MPQSRLQPCLTRLRWSGGVTAGQAEIHSQGDLTTITQSSQNAAINWQSFSVAPQETVQFKQPNSDSITLNRVTGNEASDIQGQIKANGHIFISNPNGVLIGNNAQINVGGLVATTQKISDEDFMANRFNFTGEGKGVVENRGHIQVPKGGVVALVAPIVKNSGKITALQANTLLASAEHFSITLPSNNKFSYQITKGTLQGLVDNGGAILADGGYVVLTAKGLSAVKKSVINHSGTIQANTVSNKNGKIELLGDLDNSQLNVAGKLIAEAPNSGDGGFIETSAAKVKIDDHVNVSTKSTKGSSGTWLIDPNDFVIGGKNADMTANTLSRQLDNGNVTVKSTNGKATGKGDIIINKQVDWNKNRLTLSAQNDILINKTLNGTGTASLVMEYGLATSDGGESDFYLQKYVPLAERTAAINLPEGKNLRVRKGSAGEFTTFDVIHKMPEILEDGTNAEFPSNHIALGQDIDLSYTKTLNNPKFAGWKDKTSYYNQNANFWGLGHKVKNLYINATEVPSSYVGFLTNTYASIRDIGVEGEISSNTAVGGLAGRVSNNNYNYIKNSYTNINIISSSTAAGLISHVSGNETNKTEVSNVYSIGNITVNNNNVGNIGGVFGFVYDAVIKDSYGKNKITVSNNDYTDSYIGGFIASSENSTISNSYFNGDISFSSGVAQGIGGLIGESRDNTILNSYSNGHLLVSGRSGSLYEGVGGLLGYSSDDSINNSYSLVTVNASESSYVGGLVGQSTTSKGVQKINNSYSSGLVIGKNFVGGLVGYNRDSISIANSYSTSNVRGEDSVGGLIGRSYGSVDLTNVYSSGEVSGKENVAGLYFAPFRTAEDNVANSYTLGNIRGEGNVKRFISSGFGYRGTTTNSGVLDYDALKDKSSFKNWDFENVWEIKDGQYPTLRNVGVVTPEAPPAVEDVDEPEVEPVKPEVSQPQPEIDHKPKALELLKSAALIRKNMENKLTILANQGVDADIVSLNNNITNAKREAQAEIEKVTNSQDKLELNLQLEAITLLDDATINAAKQTAAQKRKEAEDKRLEEERKQKEAERLEKERKEKAESDRLAQEAARIKAEKLKEDQKLKDAARDAYNKAFVTQKQMQARLNNGEISFEKAKELVAQEKEVARKAIEKVNDVSYRSEYLAKLNGIKPLVAVKPVEQPKPVPSKPTNQPKVEGKQAVNVQVEETKRTVNKDEKENSLLEKSGRVIIDKAVVPIGKKMFIAGLNKAFEGLLSEESKKTLANFYKENPPKNPFNLKGAVFDQIIDVYSKEVGKSSVKMLNDFGIHNETMEALFKDSVTFIVAEGIKANLKDPSQVDFKNMGIGFVKNIINSGGKIAKKSINEYIKTKSNNDLLIAESEFITDLTVDVVTTLINDVGIEWLSGKDRSVALLKWKVKLTAQMAYKSAEKVYKLAEMHNQSRAFTQTIVDSSVFKITSAAQAYSKLEFYKEQGNQEKVEYLSNVVNQNFNGNNVVAELLHFGNDKHNEVELILMKAINAHVEGNSAESNKLVEKAKSEAKKDGHSFYFSNFANGSYSLEDYTNRVIKTLSEQNLLN